MISRQLKTIGDKVSFEFRVSRFEPLLRPVKLDGAERGSRSKLETWNSHSMGLKGKIEAIIYAAEEPVTLEQISFLVKPTVLQELAEEQARAAEVAAAAVQEAASESQDQASETEAISEPPVQDPGKIDDQPATDTAAVQQTPEAASPAAAEEAVAPESEQPSPVALGNSSETLVQAEATEHETGAEPAPEVQDEQVAPESKTEVVAESQAEQPRSEASDNAIAPIQPKRKPRNEVPPEVKVRVREVLEELISDYASSDRGMEIRRIAGGFRMATKPEHHDVVKAFAKILKPPLRLSLPALETLAVVAYKQPVTAPEVSEIRGVDSQGVIATLLDRKLITTAGRKAVIGRPILYKTTKEFLLKFGLKDVSELPSMEEFEKLAQDAGQVDMFAPDEEPAGQSTLHDVEATPDSEAASDDHAAQSVEGDIESGMERKGDNSAEADTSESVVRSQVEGEQADAQPSEPRREVAGDYSSGADTAESIVRAQVEGEDATTESNQPQPDSEESLRG